MTSNRSQSQATAMVKNSVILMLEYGDCQRPMRPTARQAAGDGVVSGHTKTRRTAVVTARHGGPLALKTC